MGAGGTATAFVGGVRPSLRIPEDQLERASRFALAERDRGGFEAAGFFCWRPHVVDIADGGTGRSGAVATCRFFGGENVARRPTQTCELAAEWIVELIRAGWYLAGPWHSHPAGTPNPSLGDYEGFPVHYAVQGLIDYDLGCRGAQGLESSRLVRYDRDGFELVPWNECWLEVLFGWVGNM